VTCLEVFRPAELLNDFWASVRSAGTHIGGQPRADRVDPDVTGQAEGGGPHESFDTAVGDGEAGGLRDWVVEHVAGHERERASFGDQRPSEQDETDLTEELALDPHRQLVLRHRVERTEVGLTRRTHERIEGADLPEDVAHGVRRLDVHAAAFCAQWIGGSPRRRSVLADGAPTGSRCRDAVGRAQPPTAASLKPGERFSLAVQPGAPLSRSASSTIRPSGPRT
jgi:hypothetical protein